MAKRRLFAGEPARDTAYLNIRSGRNELLLRCREQCEALWERYEGYADTHFLSEICSNFHERYWEMYLTVALIECGYEVTCPKPGPDVGIVFEDRRIWFEATCPGPGAEGTADRVPDIVIGVAQYTPNDAMILRYTSALDAKRRQYETWLADGLVDERDAYVIALNPKKLGHEYGDTNPPRVLQAVLPLGPLYVTIDAESLNTKGSGYLYRSELTKKSGRNVKTGLFLDKDYGTVSGVLCSRVDAGNLPSQIGADFQLVPNPRSTVRLPPGFRLPGTYFGVDLSDEGFTVTPDPPLR